MTEKKYNEISNAGKTLCEFCEADACESCMVTRLLDDAYTEFENSKENDSEEITSETVPFEFACKRTAYGNFYTVNAPFGTVYVEIKATEGGVKILDSNEKYIGEIPPERLLDIMIEHKLSAVETVKRFIVNEILTKKTVLEFLDAVPIVYGYVTESFDEMIHEYVHTEYPNEEMLFKHEFVVKIGNSYVALY